MKSTVAIPVLTLLAAALAAALPSSALAEASEHATQVASSFDRFREAEDKFGFLQQNCMECHNDEDWAGSLAFNLISPTRSPTTLKCGKRSSASCRAA